MVARLATTAGNCRNRFCLSILGAMESCTRNELVRWTNHTLVGQQLAVWCASAIELTMRQDGYTSLHTDKALRSLAVRLLRILHCDCMVI